MGEAATQKSAQPSHQLFGKGRIFSDERLQGV
jgi:hypothetical protein